MRRHGDGGGGGGGWCELRPRGGARVRGAKGGRVDVASARGEQGVKSVASDERRGADAHVWRDDRQKIAMGHPICAHCSMRARMCSVGDPRWCVCPTMDGGRASVTVEAGSVHGLLWCPQRP